MRSSRLSVEYLVRLVLVICFMFTIIALFILKPPETTVTDSITAPELEVKLSEFTKISYISMKHDKWIVINIPPEQNTVKFLMRKVEGWKILITGSDRVTADLCTIPYCVFLTPQTLKQIPSSFDGGYILDMDINGYAYAIKHGAKYILSVSPEVELIRNLDSFSYESRISGIVYDEQYMFNSTIFTQKLPQRMRVSMKKNTNKYPFKFLLKDEMFPAIQLPLYQCRSFKYENNTIKYNTDTQLKQHSKLAPIFVGSGNFADIRSSVVLYRYEAFWSLFLNSINTKRKHFPMMLLVQKLLNFLDFHVMFIPSKPCLIQDSQYAKNNITDYLDGSRIKKFVNSLRSKSCKEFSVFTCLLKLSHILAMENLIGVENVQKLGSWLVVLKRLHYKETPMIALNKSREVTRDIPMLMSTHMYSVSDIKYMEELAPSIINITHANDVCPELNMTWRQPMIDDVMLVVTFNEVKWYKNVIYLELMYRRYFRYILYCGPQPSEFHKLIAEIKELTTFFYVEGLSESWYYMYECTQYAMMMNFRVKGYLQIGDDTLVNTWNMFRLPRDQLILPNYLVAYNRSSEKKEWYFWNTDNGRAALNRVFVELQTAANLYGNKLAKRFLVTYKLNTIITDYAFYRGGDLFYTPNSLKEMYIYLSKMSYRQKLMDEVAIPTLFMGFDRNENIFRIKDGSLWRDTARSQYWLFFDVEKIFIHPFKLSAFFVNSTGRNFFCDTYLVTSIYKFKTLIKRKPLKNTGILWNNVEGGPIIPGQTKTFLH